MGPQIYQSKILIILGIILIFFALRIPNLTLQPIFADEAIYIRWSQIMKAEEGLRFVSVTDGKTPLFMWTLIPFFNVFSDPLFAGRFLSVISGFFTLIGVYFLGKLVFGDKAAIWASLIYAITPYTVFFDRMALVDAMFSAFAIWALYFAIRLIKAPNFKFCVVLGILLGGAWLTKTPAQLMILSLPFTAIALDKKNRLFRLCLFWAVAIFIAFACYNSLRLTPVFHQLAARNADYVFPVTRLFTTPLDPFTPHLRDVADWFPKFLTWPVLGFMVYGLWRIVKEKNRWVLAILFWALVPLILQMLLLKTFTARYLLFSIPPLLVLAGFGVDRAAEAFKGIKVIKAINALLLLFFALRFDFQLITNPPPDNLPAEERRGYFEDWTAGYGFPEIAKFLIEERKKGPVVVGTEGSFGTLPDGLFIYLDKADIALVGGRAQISDGLRASAKVRTTFFVGNRNRVNKTDLGNVRLIKTYEKQKPLDGSEQDAIVVYQILP